MIWVAIDMDGTVANCDHRLVHIIDLKTGQKLPSGKRNYSKFFQNCRDDLPIQENIVLVKNVVKELGAVPIFMTGRPEKMFDESKEWIDRYVYPDGGFLLFMRKDTDHSADFIAKAEMMKFVSGMMQEPPSAIFDDTPRVLEAWKNLCNSDVRVYNFSKA